MEETNRPLECVKSRSVMIYDVRSEVSEDIEEINEQRAISVREF